MKAFVVGLMFALMSAAIGYTYFAQTLISAQISAQEETLSHLEGNVRLIAIKQSDSDEEYLDSVLAAEVKELKDDYINHSHSVNELKTSAATFARELGGYGELLQKLEVAVAEQKDSIQKTVKAAVKEATAKKDAKKITGVPTVPGVPTAPLVAKPEAIKPRPVTELPFDVLTVENRGEEPFLVIGPKGVRTLSMARFYRAGDEVDGYWLLKVIVPEQRLAVFVNLDSQTFTYRW